MHRLARIPTMAGGGGECKCIFFAFFCISRSQWFFAYFAFFCIFLHMFCLQFPFNFTIHGQICVTWCCK